MVKYMAVAVAVAVDVGGDGAVAVAVAMAGRWPHNKDFSITPKKDFLIRIWGYRPLPLQQPQPCI